MAWEWSHSHEAYVHGRSVLDTWSREQLEVVLAEWQATDHKQFGPDRFDPEAYDTRLAGLKAKALPTDVLADAVWEYASDYEFGRTCDNGGFNLWVCPYGCHTVPASPATN